MYLFFFVIIIYLFVLFSLSSWKFKYNNKIIFLLKRSELRFIKAWKCSTFNLPITNFDGSQFIRCKVTAGVGDPSSYTMTWCHTTVGPTLPSRRDINLSLLTISGVRYHIDSWGHAIKFRLQYIWNELILNILSIYFNFYDCKFVIIEKKLYIRNFI